MWTIYDIIILSYIGAFNDIVVIICNISVLLLGYSKLMHISKFRIVKYNYLTKKTINKMYKLDINNFGEHNTWDKKFQLDVYKKNKDSLFAIKYKHEFAGYINYLTVNIDYYEKLKKIRKIPNIIDIDEIVKFKAGKKNYILIESISIKKEYEKDLTIELIGKKIYDFINRKQRQRVYIHGVLGFALSEFEKKTFEYLNFTPIKELSDDGYLYELDINNIRKNILK